MACGLASSPWKLVLLTQSACPGGCFTETSARRTQCTLPHSVERENVSLVITVDSVTVHLKKRTPSYSNDHLSACGQIKIHRRKTQAISEDEAQTASQHLIPFYVFSPTLSEMSTWRSSHCRHPVYNCWGSNCVESVLANLLSHTVLGLIATNSDLARVVQSVGSLGHPLFWCRCWLFTETCLNQRFPGFKKDRRDFSGSPVINNWLWNAGDSGLIPGWVTNISNLR